MVVDETNALLQVKGITVRFGGITALDSVSFDLPRDKICGLIGPNGAGKPHYLTALVACTRTKKGTFFLKENPSRIPPCTR